MQQATEGYVLKADVRHYFDTIDHKILIRILEHKIKDPKVIWLIDTILRNHKTTIPGKGMPIGNLTSQFFANVYLNELDKFIKHELRIKYYLRYVDAFVVLGKNKEILEKWRRIIENFLACQLRLELHPEKSRILPLKKGVTLLGFRIFRHYGLLKKSNTVRIWRRLERLKEKYDKGEITGEQAAASIEGWLVYAKFANTYGLRQRVMACFNELFDEPNAYFV